MVKLNYKYRSAVKLCIAQLKSYTESDNIWKHYHMAFNQLDMIVEIVVADADATTQDLRIVLAIKGKVLNKGLEL